MGADFTPDQKRYLEGFVSGMQAVGGARAQPTALASVPMGPDAAHIAAQDATTAAGKKLADQEKWKRAEHPFDAYPRLKAQAKAGAFPKPEDNFRWRYFGLFYVAPTQSSYMARLRIPNGILTHWQFAGMAEIAARFGGGYAHVTTRANLQIREINPGDSVQVVEAVQDLGLCSRGPAPTISATSRDRRRRASTRKSSVIRGRWRANGTITSSTTARFTACRASSMSPSTAAG